MDMINRSLARPVPPESPRINRKKGEGWYAVHADFTQREIGDCQVHRYYEVFTWVSIDGGRFQGQTDGSGWLYADEWDDFICYAHPDRFTFEDYVNVEHTAREMLAAFLANRPAGLD